MRGRNDALDVPAAMPELEALFESIEPGSSIGLRQLEGIEYKYKVGMGEYVFRPSHTITEFIDLNLIRKSFSMQLLTSMSRHVVQYFKDPKLIKLLEFPVLFLGCKAGRQNTRYVQHDELCRPGFGHLVPDGRHERDCKSNGVNCHRIGS